MEQGEQQKQYYIVIYNDQPIMICGSEKYANAFNESILQEQGEIEPILFEPVTIDVLKTKKPIKVTVKHNGSIEAGYAGVGYASTVISNILEQPEIKKWETTYRVLASDVAEAIDIVRERYGFQHTAPADGDKEE